MEAEGGTQGPEHAAGPLRWSSEVTAGVHLGLLRRGTDGWQRRPEEGFQGGSKGMDLGFGWWQRCGDTSGFVAVVRARQESSGHWWGCFKGERVDGGGFRVGACARRC